MGDKRVAHICGKQLVHVAAEAFGAEGAASTTLDPAEVMAGKETVLHNAPLLFTEEMEETRN